MSHADLLSGFISYSNGSQVGLAPRSSYPYTIRKRATNTMNAEWELMMHDGGKNNLVSIGKNSEVDGRIIGNNNIVKIEDATMLRMNLHIRGSNNKVYIGPGFRGRDLTVSIGNSAEANGVSFHVGRSVSVEPNCYFHLYNSQNSLKIDDGCMLSNSIIIRTGESPHLIFNDETGEYLDAVGDVIIGAKSWVGERAYITKNAKIAPNTIVAACSVVTRAFQEEMTVIAGNPAEVKKRGVRWIRNRTQVPKGSKFQESIERFDAETS